MSAFSQIATALRRRTVPAPGTRVVLTGRKTRPLWFDGRFLAARDLQSEQQYFLQRQAAFGRAGGFGVVHGLLVDQGATTTQPASAETIVIHAGDGITPDGDLVMIPNDLTIRLSDIATEENLEEQFGLSETPQQPARTRTGLYILALRPVEFTANPITSYPRSLQAPRVTQDGDIVEATAVSLIPYPNPVNNYDMASQQAAVAREIFIAGNTGVAPGSVLPIAMISVDRNVIQWIDPYLVRRDSGPEYSGTRFGLTDPATQQAFLLQYDAQLQAAVSARQSTGAKANFSATDFFQALPSAGRLPLDAIDFIHFTHTFFPQQMSVQLTLVPADELPAIVEDSLSLPPVDLTLTADAYANIAVCVLVAAPRNNYAALAAQLPPAPLNPALPQVAVVRPLLPPLPLLQKFPLPVNAVSGSPWDAATKDQTYGFYVRRHSEPVFADFTMPAQAQPAQTTTTPTPTTTPPPATTAGH